MAAWLVTLAFVERSSGIAVLCGMAGPLVMACGSWVISERTYKRDPRALTGLMLTAFAFKMVFFGGYVAVVLRILHLPAVPFAVSFSSYFIALHFVEALFLKRLFGSDPRA
ncbi:MAG: hypothetical protein QM736_15940 [Vicinamibacterales bacterium]